MAQPKLSIKDSLNVYQDITKYVAEMHPIREDLDAEGAGRSAIDGKMYRKRIARKWTIDVTFIPMQSSNISSIVTLISPTKFSVKWQSPIGTEITSTMYCSRIDFGKTTRAGTNDTQNDSVKIKLVEV